MKLFASIVRGVKKFAQRMHLVKYVMSPNSHFV